MTVLRCLMTLSEWPSLSKLIITIKGGQGSKRFADSYFFSLSCSSVVWPPVVAFQSRIELTRIREYT